MGSTATRNGIDMNTSEGMVRLGLAAVVLASAVASAECGAAAALPLIKVADVPLGGRATRMDYASLDAGRHLLFIAHMGDSAVIVFDTRTDRVVTRIGGVADVHGVLAVPELGRVYATATGSDELVAIDEASLKVVARAGALTGRRRRPTRPLGCRSRRLPAPS